MSNIQKISWQSSPEEKMTSRLTRRKASGEKGTMAWFSAKAGGRIERHAHPNEEYLMVLSGSLKFTSDDRELALKANEAVIIPPDVAHAIEFLEDTEFIDFFTPVREDWLQGKDQYLRRE